MFKIVMIIAIILLAMGWIAYGIWRYRENYIEKNRPKSRAKPTTEHLEKVKESFDEYTKKLEGFKKKTYKREDLE